MADFSFQSGEVKDALLKWWSGLQEDRGGRAELRRCHSPLEVAFCPSFHKLVHSLSKEGSSVNQEALAVIAGVLPHIEGIEPGKSLAKQMASPKDSGDLPKVSELRFRRLLKNTSREDLYEPLIRIVKLLNGRVNLLDAAESIYFWGEKVRKRWAYEYYA